MALDSMTPPPEESDLAAPPATAEVGDSVPSSDPPADTGGAVSEWNGERESLLKESWWNELPETVRATVERGIQTKYTNFHRGADRARSEAAAALQAERDRAAELQAALDNVQKDQEFFNKLLSEDDALKPLTERLNTLEQALSERDKRIADYESKYADIELERVQERHRSKYQDIFDDFQEDPNWKPESGEPPNPTGAYVEFARLLQAGWSEERAAKVVRAEMALRAPAPTPARQPEPVPKSVALASDGAGPRADKTVREVGESFEEVMRRKRAELLAAGDE
jgi:hypothetical protein